MSVLDIWLEGGARPGPVRLHSETELPAVLWVDGSAPGTEAGYPYRNTRRSHDGLAVYEPVPGSGH